MILRAFVIVSDAYEVLGKVSKSIKFGIIKYVIQIIIEGGNSMNKKLLAVIFGSALMLAACGGDNNESKQILLQTLSTDN